PCLQAAGLFPHQRRKEYVTEIRSIRAAEQCPEALPGLPGGERTFNHTGRDAQASGSSPAGCCGRYYESGKIHLFKCPYGSRYFIYRKSGDNLYSWMVPVWRETFHHRMLPRRGEERGTV